MSYENTKIEALEARIAQLESAVLVLAKFTRIPPEKLGLTRANMQHDNQCNKIG